MEVCPSCGHVHRRVLARKCACCKENRADWREEPESED